MSLGRKVSGILTGRISLAKIPRFLTARIRLFPDFIIIGGQKCGTSSLYKYLIQHPDVGPAWNKELHFFDFKFNKGVNWYRAHFPSLFSRYLRRMRHQDLVSGEASPYYIFHPLAPQRIFKTIPKVKLIALLRNPVDRAYSHYHMVSRQGFESLSFEEAIAREQERLRDQDKWIVEDEDYYSPDHHHHSYLSRGIYVDQLKVWLDLFPNEQMLILKSEDFSANPAATLQRVGQFLKLSSWEPKGYKKHNKGNYSTMTPAIRKHLIDYFEPHNQRLYEFLGVDIKWDK